MKGLVVFPRADVANCLWMTYPGASRRLGIHRSTLLEAANRYGFSDCFTDARSLSRSFVSPSDLCSCRGMLRIDAAAVLGVSRCAVVRSVQKHGLDFLFPRHGGEAQFVSRRGYV